ncbi:hypothetical protein PN446_11110, partial [Microcystis aeruginosa CS-567/02]|nr:hypothetical protein [Microcystis aeruginosa CS-567/02]
SLCLSKWLPFLTFLLISLSISTYCKGEMLPGVGCRVWGVGFYPFSSGKLSIAFLIHKRYIPDPEQLNQQRFKCAAQMREPL